MQCRSKDDVKVQAGFNANILMRLKTEQSSHYIFERRSLSPGGGWERERERDRNNVLEKVKLQWFRRPAAACGPCIGALPQLVVQNRSTILIIVTIYSIQPDGGCGYGVSTGERLAAMRSARAIMALNPT